MEKKEVTLTDMYNNKRVIDVTLEEIDNYLRIRAEDRIKALSILYDDYDLTADILRQDEKYVTVQATLRIRRNGKELLFSDIVCKPMHNPDNIATAVTIAKSRAIASSGILIEYGISSYDEIKSVRGNKQAIKNEKVDMVGLHKEIDKKDKEDKEDTKPELEELENWINENIKEDMRPRNFVKRLTIKTAQLFIDAAKNNQLDEDFLRDNGYIISKIPEKEKQEQEIEYPEPDNRDDNFLLSIVQHTSGKITIYEINDILKSDFKDMQDFAMTANNEQLNKILKQ